MPLTLMESAHTHLIRSSASAGPRPQQVLRCAGFTFYAITLTLSSQLVGNLLILIVLFFVLYCAYLVRCFVAEQCPGNASILVCNGHC